ncbi:hypothetical protein OCU04_008406 [Sclerotinia nivalis]|uniref:Uncharacterized protein n=1 Tax=Sclerotinia nivalis TaxID=352851 RepID=A0A9X0DIT0_9HELO|nr:hypothetical protein OCU04_008406 [Sclerotinia nivalis]
MIILHLRIDLQHQRESWHRNIVPYPNENEKKDQSYYDEEGAACISNSIVPLGFGSFVGLTDVRYDMYKEPGEFIPCENSYAVVSERGNSNMFVLHEFSRVPYNFDVGFPAFWQAHRPCIALQRYVNGLACDTEF